MPELPDVEHLRQTMESTARNRRIVRVRVEPSRLFKGISSQDITARLTGNRLVETRRHGKHLLARISGDGWLVLHFGMTGKLAHWRENETRPSHSRLQIDFEDNSHLAYISVRKLGQIALTESVDDFRSEHHLGPDALDPGLDFRSFVGRIGKSQSAVKCWLMDQKNLAGIGNVYSDEILFRARLNPRTRLDRLSEKEVRRLFEAMQTVLRGAIEAGAEPSRLPDTFLLPHRKLGASCPNHCGGTVLRMSACGRTGYYCPHCQPGQ